MASDRDRTQTSLKALRRSWSVGSPPSELGSESPRTLSLLTDFGHKDEFVGVVHAVLRCLAPEIPVIDISHGLPPFAVRAAARALARATPYLPPGVAMVVVDPGVGTDRAALAVKARQHDLCFVGPDNGVLSNAVVVAGGASSVVRVTEEKFRLDGAAATFDGRDLFSPVAAFLALGGDIGEVGPEIDPAEMRELPPEVLRVEAGALVCEITWIDRFGNAQLSAARTTLSSARYAVELPSGATVEAEVFDSYEQVPTDHVGLVMDSQRRVALCANRGSAASRLHLVEGELVRLVPPRPSETGS